MKSFQDRLFKDFDVKKIETKDGKIKNVYVYKGTYMMWLLTEEEIIRQKRICLGSGIILALLYLWAAFQRVPVNASKISGGVTLLAFVALMVLEIGLFRFFRSKREMYQRDCQEIRTLILWSSMLYFLLQTVNVCAGAVFLVMNKETILSVLVVLANAGSAALSLLLFLAQNKIRAREIPENKIIEGHFE